MNTKVFPLFIMCSIIFYGNCALAWESYIAQSYTMYVKDILPANLVEAASDYNSAASSFTIKFYGIGIPSLKQPFGDEAHQYLVKLLPKNAKIIVSIIGKDEEGILTGLIQYKDHSVNNSLVEQGYAWVERSSCKAFFCRRWYIQEHIAVKDRRGIWSMNTTRTPWQWSNQ